MKKLIRIFTIFFKIGSTTFGGGYAMLPIIEREICTNYKLLKEEDFIDLISVAQSFPGPVAVNISMLTGFKIMGFLGSVIALLGVVLPSFISIVVIGYFYSKYKDLKLLNDFFTGVMPVIPALLLISFLKVFKKNEKKNSIYFIFAISFLLLYLNFNPIYIILFFLFLGFLS